MGLTISVCMAAYNGAGFIEQQLYSILHQSRKPDEVIVCDDGSADDTTGIIRRFIEKNHLGDNWKLYQNPENKGYPGNFYYAMGLCSGDVVFLADQDDIWHECKLEHMIRVLEQHSQAAVVSCKYSLIDAQGSDIHSLMAPARTAGTGQLRSVDIRDVFYKCEWPGMVMAYRRAWYAERVREGSLIPHDFLVCALAAEEERFLQLDEQLACHRRHENNSGGEEHRIRRLLSKDRKQKEIEDYLAILRCFEEEQILQTQGGRKALDDKLASMQGRCEALHSGSIGKVLKNAFKNRREVRMATLICDLLIVKR